MKRAIEIRANMEMYWSPVTVNTRTIMLPTRYRYELARDPDETVVAAIREGMKDLYALLDERADTAVLLTRKKISPSHLTP